MRQAGVAGAYFQHLVDLLLVLNDRKSDFSILEDIDNFAGLRIRIDRHGHSTQRLNGNHCRVQARPVFADQGQIGTTLKSDAEQTAGQCFYFAPQVTPCPRLPDAKVFFANRRRIRSDRAMLQEQAWEGRIAQRAHLLKSRAVTDGGRLIRGHRVINGHSE